MLHFIKSKIEKFWDSIFSHEVSTDIRKQKIHLTKNEVKTIEQIYKVYPTTKDTTVAKQYNISISTARRIRVGDHRYSRSKND